MSDSKTRSADVLFRQWLEQLAAGSLSTAAFVAADYPALIPALQARINDCLSSRAADLDATLQESAGDPEAAAVPPAIPGYRVLEHLGRGGMGEVWRVKDELDQEFALKMARADRLSPAGKVRFHAEARAMKQVEHPFIAPVYHFLWHHDTPYFLMDVYPASLRDWIAVYQADPVKAVRLMAAVAEAVGAMHAKRMVHRDLKPGNVLLTADGTPKVSDLGLAKCIGDDPAAESGPHKPVGAAPAAATTQRTSAGSVLGTRAYMAPEQAAGLVHLANPKWDVFALGVILHELLTGRLPASSVAPQDLLNPDRPDNPSPATVKLDLDPTLARIIRKCLARAEADRYADGADLAAALRLWLAVREPKARPKRRPWVAAGVFVAVALAAGAAVQGWRLLHPPEVQADDLPQPDPVREFQARLRADGTAEVIPNQGLPAWSDLAVGKGLVQPHLAPDDGALTIDSGRLILMDLPPTGRDRFRFDVQVRQASGAKNALFGVYAGRHARQTETGDIECYLALGFNDRSGPPTRPVPRWVLAARAYRPTPGVGGYGGGFEFNEGRYTVPKPGDYHDLRIDVRPTGVTFWLDGVKLEPIPLPLPAVVGSALPGGATTFTPGGGYGLLVYGGTCVFRRGTVSLLPDPD